MASDRVAKFLSLAAFVGTEIRSMPTTQLGIIPESPLQLLVAVSRTGSDMGINLGGVAETGDANEKEVFVVGVSLTTSVDSTFLLFSERFDEDGGETAAMYESVNFDASAAMLELDDSLLCVGSFDECFFFPSLKFPVPVSAFSPFVLKQPTSRSRLSSMVSSESVADAPTEQSASDDADDPWHIFLLPLPRVKMTRIQTAPVNATTAIVADKMKGITATIATDV